MMRAAATNLRFNIASIVAVVVAPAGCSANTAPDPDSSDPVSDPGTDLPGDDPDDEAGGDECVPYCHWDCFSAEIACIDPGHVYAFGYGPRPCCDYSDPWPGGGPDCNVGIRYQCETTCASLGGYEHGLPDPRYVFCLYGEDPDDPGTLPVYGLPEEFYRIFCAEGQPHEPGDPCDSDGDCRPSAGGRLACDALAGVCSDAPPVDSPAWLGVDCGLRTGEGFWEYEINTDAPECTVCHVGADRGTCVEQGCTMPCVFDEDCPSGYVCVCEGNYYAVSMVCAATANPLTREGRAEGLACF